jgi:hypothetical protein
MAHLKGTVQRMAQMGMSSNCRIGVGSFHHKSNSRMI